MINEGNKFKKRNGLSKGLKESQCKKKKDKDNSYIFIYIICQLDDFAFLSSFIIIILFVFIFAFNFQLFNWNLFCYCFFVVLWCCCFFEQDKRSWILAIWTIVWYIHHDPYHWLKIITIGWSWSCSWCKCKFTNSFQY